MKNDSGQFSKQAAAPRKLAEFLGCDKPCLGNADVGDKTGVLEAEQLGVAIGAFDSTTMAVALRRPLALVADPVTPARCVVAAPKHFSLDEGVARYAMVCEQLVAHR